MPSASVQSLMKLERAQTRLRMSRTQIGFWGSVVLLVWVLSSGGLFYWRLDAAGRFHCAPWIVASMVASVAPNVTLPYFGERHRAGDIATSLARKVYHQSLLQWVWSNLQWGLLPACVMLCSVVGWASWRGAIDGPVGEHVRGVQILTSLLLQQRVLTPRFSWRKLRRVTPAAGVSVAGVTLARPLELTHMVVCGSTGSGKSTVIRSLLRQLERRSEVAVVVDPERDFLEQFYRPERGDVILNPTDARCPYWSPWLEMAEPGDAEALAKSLLPDPPSDGSGADLFFRQSARQLFVSLLDRLPQRDPHAIPQLLFGPAAALTALVKDTPASSLIDDSAPQQRAGIVGTLQLAVKAFNFLPASAPSTWNARQWEQDRRGWLFLTFRSGDKAAVLPLISLWLDALIRRVLDTDLRRAERERVWIVIDELASLQRQQHLEELLMRGRKHGAPAIIGFQAITQLRSLYGHNAAATMLAAPKTKLLLQSGEPETAQWCSRAIGGREVIRPQESETAGPENVRDAISLVYQRREEAAVLPSEISQLRDLTGYLCIAGAGVAAVTIPPEPRQPRCAGFLSRFAQPLTTDGGVRGDEQRNDDVTTADETCTSGEVNPEQPHPHNSARRRL